MKRLGLATLTAGTAAPLPSIAAADLGVRVALPICGATPPQHYARTLIGGDTGSNNFTPWATCTGSICNSQWTDYEQSVPIHWGGGVAYLPWTTMDFGGGNEIMNTFGQECVEWLGLGGARIDTNYASSSLLPVEGFVNNITSSSVHGEIVFGTYHNVHPLILAVQVLNGDTGSDVATKYVASCDVTTNGGCLNTVGEIDAAVPANS